MNHRKEYDDMERHPGDMTDFRRPPYSVRHPQSGCSDIQNMSTAERMIRAQGEQLKHRLTFRDLLDRIMHGIQNGDFVMSDPVPEGFLQDGHMGVAEYLADKYDIRGDADE